jgi:hypothetical protein
MHVSAVSLCLFLAIAGGQAVAQSATQDDLATPPPPGLRENSAEWSREKCTRYQRAWVETVRRKGTKGLSDEFRQRHDAFLASGCLEGRNVCPRSKEELDMANILIIAGMNAGMSGTFFPFSCRGN